MFSFDFDHFRTRYTELIRFIIIQAFIILQFKLNKYGLFIYVFIQKKMKIYEFCYDIEKLASVFFFLFKFALQTIYTDKWTLGIFEY